MKTVLLLLSILVTSYSLAQDKNTHYYTFNLKKEITKDEFQKIYSNYDTYQNVVEIRKNDTSIIKMLHPRKQFDVLDPIVLDSLKGYLNYLTNKKNVFKDYIVINYFSGNEPYEAFNSDTKSYVVDKGYVKKINKLLKCNQFSIYKEKKDIKYFEDKKLWIKDDLGVIKNLFFYYQIPYGSFVIIKSDGTFISLHGEHNKDMVYEIAEEIKKDIKKVEHYTYDFKQKIEPSEFDSLLNYNNNSIRNFELNFESDSIFYKMIHPARRYGVLKKHQIDSVKNYINKISKTQNTFKDYIVINYNSGDAPNKDLNSESRAYIYKPDYQKQLNTIIDCNQFWVFKDDKNIKYRNKKNINWIKDEASVFKNLFFKYQIPYGSFVIIKSDGRYIVNYGEYSPNMVYDIAKEVSGQSSNQITDASNLSIIDIFKANQNFTITKPKDWFEVFHHGYVGYTPIQPNDNHFKTIVSVFQHNLNTKALPFNTFVDNQIKQYKDVVSIYNASLKEVNNHLGTVYIHEFETETHQVIVMYFQNNGHYYQYKYSALDKSFKKHLNSALLILDSISFK
ncbi:hypothetical protein [Olleya sp. AS48]|uniref:hypothetical protein n=1 Tax=Olleya sp. AS48 TaxID=3135774 RepID=UPI00317B64C6